MASQSDQSATPPEPKPARTLGPLRMIWQAALAYPGKLALAALAILIADVAD